MHVHVHLHVHVHVCMYVYVPMLARDDWAVIRVGNDTRGPALSEMM